MQVRFLGVRGSYPCAVPALHRYGSNTSSVVLSVDGEPPILLDLGTGLLSGLSEAGPFLNEPFRATALVTHLHLDHVQGLPFFPPAHRAGSRLDVYGPAQPAGTLRDAFEGMIGPPYFPVPLDDFGGDLRFHEVWCTEIEVGSAHVTVRPVPHVGPTVGYRVTWGGGTVVYVSDHQAPPALDRVDEGVLELCQGADLLIHEAQYTPEEFAAKPTWGHCTVDYAVLVAMKAGARRLCLYHHDPSRTDDELDALVIAARRAVEGSAVEHVFAAAEGTTFNL